MTRTLALLSSAALIAVTASAQGSACFTGPAAGLVKWSAGAGYGSAFNVDDEGITSPPIALTAFANFPMAGAIGNLDTLWVNSNGEIYLTDSTLALTQPVNGAAFGITSNAEMRGNLANASARICVLGGDNERSSAAGANWSVNVDQSVAGQVKVTWTDMTRFTSITEKFTFGCTLFASGAVEYSYNNTFPVGYFAPYVGISIGNNVGPTALSSDLSTGANSGTVGLLFQNFTAAAQWDLSGQSFTISPNGTGGYVAGPFVASANCASHTAYGAGCYSFNSTTNGANVQLFADSPTAKLALDGNALLFSKTANGYVSTWIPGGGSLYLAPTGGAVSLATGDDGAVTFNPSAPIPVPNGVAATWTVSGNGIISAAAASNNAGDFSPTLAEIGTSTGLAFYTWRDWNVAEAGSGLIKREEAGGVLYITFDGVEAYGTPSPNVGTWQCQINMTTGDVTLVWVSFEGSTSADDVIVGATLLGTDATPTSVDFATAGSIVMSQVILNPLTLSANNRPVNGGAPVTYTVSNIPELLPTSSIYVAFIYASGGQVPAPGVDLGVIGAPGCGLYLASLDIPVSLPVSFTPSTSVTIPWTSATIPASLYLQGFALFDPAFPLPNGQNAFGLTSSNGLTVTVTNN